MPAALTHAVPNNMNPTVFPNSQLGPPNRPERSDTPRLCIYLYGSGEFSPFCLLANVKNVPAIRLSFEINQMNSAPRVDCGLRLNSAVGRAPNRDARRLRYRRTEHNNEN